jgi:hypothetical protein
MAPTRVLLILLTVMSVASARTPQPHPFAAAGRHGVPYHARRHPESLQSLFESEHLFGQDASRDGLAYMSALATHYRFFASHTEPEIVIPDMIRDLRLNSSRGSYETYLGVLQQWPAERVLPLLIPFCYSLDIPLFRTLLPFQTYFDDEVTAQIADALYADLEPH